MDITTTGISGFANSYAANFNQSVLSEAIKDRLAQVGLTLTQQLGTAPIKLGYTVVLNGSANYGTFYLIVEIPAFSGANCTITVRLYSAPSSAPNTYYNITTLTEVVSNSGVSSTFVVNNSNPLIGYSVKKSDSPSYFGVAFVNAGTTNFVGFLGMAYPSYFPGIVESTYNQGLLIIPSAPYSFKQPLPNPGSSVAPTHYMGLNMNNGAHPVNGNVAPLPSPIVTWNSGQGGAVAAFGTDVAVLNCSLSKTNSTFASKWWVLYPPVTGANENGVGLAYA